jgi:hypothetical protein
VAVCLDKIVGYGLEVWRVGGTTVGSGAGGRRRSTKTSLWPLHTSENSTRLSSTSWRTEWPFLRGPGRTRCTMPSSSLPHLARMRSTTRHSRQRKSCRCLFWRLVLIIHTRQEWPPNLVSQPPTSPGKSLPIRVTGSSKNNRPQLFLSGANRSIAQKQIAPTTTIIKIPIKSEIIVPSLCG